MILDVNIDSIAKVRDVRNLLWAQATKYDENGYYNFTISKPEAQSLKQDPGYADIVKYARQNGEYINEEDLVPIYGVKFKVEE